MNIYLIGLPWVFGAMAIAASFVIVIRRFVSAEHREAGDEAAARIFTVVAGLHAVLIAFVLISLLDDVDSASTYSYQEANGLVAVYWGADMLPQPARSEIQNMCHSYATTVVDKEWPEMRDDQPVGTAGRVQLDQIQEAIASVTPTSQAQEDSQTNVENQLSAVYQARQQRLSTADSTVDPILWMALIVGTILSVGLACLFGASKLPTHVIVVAAMAGIFAILLFATYQLQDPFGGGVKVGPDAFLAALGQFH